MKVDPADSNIAMQQRGVHGKLPLGELAAHLVVLDSECGKCGVNQEILLIAAGLGRKVLAIAATQVGALGV